MNQETLIKYSEGFAKKLEHQPIKSRLRLFSFWLQRIRKNLRLQQLNSSLSEDDYNSLVKVPFCLQDPPYKYQGYQGPWIEDFFYEYWVNNHLRKHLTYLPILFDSFFFHSQVHKYTPRQFKYIYSQMLQVLQESIHPDKIYFTILGMYDFPIWDWHNFPKNVLVFSAGGGGDVPIPLLKGSPEFKCPTKEILVSFMGRLDGASNSGNVRQKMYETLKEVAYFGQGSHWRSVMEKSTFTLCPRGLGQTSFRLYEAISVGSIPIYIWDDIEWLPYQDVLDWSEIAISVNSKDIDKIPDLIKAHSPEDIFRKQQRIAELYLKFFTLEAVCENIVRMLDNFNSMTDVIQITSKRRI
ncbi:exostosin family protein [Nostoc sp. FACHB-87]|uniref:exostosin domain-containing protein n=1 Tax=Nostocales TaxID=1161 RepID=UPI0016836558|nr:MULTISPECIES: exostosin family protein [Nostocales]MBD2452895.1 exostosin family protein [Nostoc sp. FACHB-87]MBD2473826.1 exostosin family protein [Anabaena sp. FACHB-83]MBD2491103.1 exostosin family protein [Aulosira sp. FACHB-615]